MEDNLQQTVPLVAVVDIESSIRFYIDGLGFRISQRWIQNSKLNWCWLQRGAAALMLQEFRTDGHDAWIAQSKVGEGVSIYFVCKDAVEIYHEITARGIKASTPFVGNGMWVTGVSDPDGYQLYFESQTDSPEGTEYKGETEM